MDGCSFSLASKAVAAGEIQAGDVQFSRWIWDTSIAAQIFCFGKRSRGRGSGLNIDGRKRPLKFALRGPDPTLTLPMKRGDLLWSQLSQCLPVLF